MARHILLVAFSVFWCIPYLTSAKPFIFWKPSESSGKEIEAYPSIAADELFDQRSIPDCLINKPRKPHKAVLNTRGRKWHGIGLRGGHVHTSIVSNDTSLAHVLGALSTTIQYLTSLISTKYGVQPLPPDFEQFWSTITGGEDWPTEDDEDEEEEADDNGDQNATHTQSSTSSSSQSTPTSSSSSIATPTSEFDPSSRNLNAVYYAQTDLTAQISLTEVCDDPNIDIVILAFVTRFFEKGGYPTVNFGSHCWATNAAQTAAGALGLLDCFSDGFAAEIAACQTGGKKVLLSLGGAYGDTSIPSQEKAVELAETLWGLFLGGTDNETLTSIRPFGPQVVLDGIDIDSENPAHAEHIPTLVSTLRDLFTSHSSPVSRRQDNENDDVVNKNDTEDVGNTTTGSDDQDDPTADAENETLDQTDTSEAVDDTNNISNSIDTVDETSVDASPSIVKRYYLTAAPQCPRPDQSMPIALLLNDLDFVSVQFYNNPSCNFNSGQLFLSSLVAWSNDLSSGTTEAHNNGDVVAGGPRLLIGVPAFSAAGSGYMPAGADFEEILRSIEHLGLENLAGFMYWDGAYQKVSGQSIEQNGTEEIGRSFAEIVKEVMV